MYVKRILATNFRNYARLELDLPARIHVFQGENAQGKTNLLEMVYYLATTRSPLSSSDRQLMHWAADAEPIPHADLQVVYNRDGEDHTLDVTMVKEARPGDPPEAARFRKRFRLDGRARRAMDIVGRLNTVLFLPRDIALVSGAPSERRRYLDICLCQLDPFYCQTLSRYNRLITQRNALLRQLRDRAAHPHELGYWDDQLSQYGAYVLWRRLWAVQQLEPEAQAIQAHMTDGGETLSLAYQDTVGARLVAGERLNVAGVDAEAQEEQIAALRTRYAQALQAARADERARGVTLIGPHRDDVRFGLNRVDATVYGSRGQQRSVALALKLAEVRLMRRHTGESPVLLLDDVISELDHSRCQLLLQSVSEAEQVLITTTDLQAYGARFRQDAVLWRVDAGAVERLDPSTAYSASAPSL